MTREPTEVQAVARLLAERVVVICTRCGQPEMTTTDGRRRHQALYEHALSGTEEARHGS